MITLLIRMLLKTGITHRAARAIAIIITIITTALLFWWLIAFIRRDAVDDYRAARAAEVAEAARKADHAADIKDAERVAAQATEQALLNEGIRNEANDEPAGPGVTGVLERIRVRGEKP